jgi:hypothetical protein
METFQKIILYSAIIILIIVLIIIGIAFSYARNEQWPPLVPECPDYWIADGSGNNTKCINIKDLGTCPPNGTKHLTMNFNTSPFVGENGDCAKYTWANRCNVTWDGITYGVNNPCQ